MDFFWSADVCGADDCGSFREIFSERGQDRAAAAFAADRKIWLPVTGQLNPEPPCPKD